ncbi:family 20 glycosylhydrolase [Cellulomonas sp. APG4]|uniref:family 20 glycosylhydrolase n=1 Tax=Cellulomonas sp. APG4 TaxID=1538656 RepID=UPI001379C50F|nr:family 20 glycosylhydrolase [Cellulomonas sp. APG4]NCT89356.1 family 20 glycosylhydrolase [Cellulomonas sp. APG4]
MTPTLVPLPLELRPGDGAPFVLGDRLDVVVDAGLGRAPDDATSAEAVAVAGAVAERLAAAARAVGTPTDVRVHPRRGWETPADEDHDVAARTPDPDGVDVPAVTLRLVDDGVRLGLTDDVAPERAAGAYLLEVTADAVVVTALAPAGLAHGAATLVQALTAGPQDVPHVPAMTVRDVPRFGWRGLSLDVARHFFDVPTVLAVLDLMWGLRLNVLHLHLTDDQGWRVEVPSRPELTDVSGKTAVGGDQGGSYTVADLARITAHAAARGITVVPEVDVPGHVNAALHACPELTPGGRPVDAYTGIEVGFSRLHADLPTTDPFLAEVFAAVAAQTPGPWVHVGGDEVLEMEREEYVRLVQAAVGHVHAAGKRAVAWQEAAHVPLPPGTVLQYWTHEQAPEPVAAAVEAGALLLLSPGNRVYLDMKYDAASPLGLEWAGHIDLRRAYEWEPLDVVPGVPASSVVGVEAAVWSETLRDLDELSWMLLPRLAAVAEVAWTEPRRRDWTDFRTRVRAVAPTWAPLSWNADALDA